jgi:hypothetical protein
MDIVRNILTSKTTWVALLVTVVPHLMPQPIKDGYTNFMVHNIDWVSAGLVALFAILPSPVKK